MTYLNLVKNEIEINIKNILENPFKNIPIIEDAILLSKKYKIPLHPRYLFYWDELSCSNLILFLEFLKKMKIKFKNNNIKFSYFPLKKEEKKIFEKLGCEHKIKTIPIDKAKSESEINLILINELNTKILLSNLGILDFNLDSNYKQIIEKQINKIIEYTKNNLSLNSCKCLSQINKIKINDKGGTYIGCRMGRPEKAKMRKKFNDETKSHSLFPVENIGGRSKNIVDVLKITGHITSNFRIYYCKNCNKESIYSKCEICDNKTQQKIFEKYTGLELEKENENSVYYKKIKIELKDIEKNLRNILGPNSPYPKHVKGISSTINKHHTTEHLSKGFLRAKNNVFVNKDGTIRFDMIEMGITHFKPIEIGTSIKKLKKIGYDKDYLGNEIINENQIVEILPQDVILPDCVESGDELASDFIINTGKYVDELLVKLYKLAPYYNFKTKNDTIGHLIIGLAPHTSAGIIGRIIGYSKTQGCFSHPVWHAAQRRNLDGDENGIMLLMDGLINFSRDYLPDRRGSRTMDVSLVLTSHLYLDQIDDEVHGMDIVDHYPLEFYKAAKKYKNPKDIKIEKIEKRINEKEVDDKYLGYKFTHNTNNLNNTILCSSYKSDKSMNEKLDLQLNLGKKIRAVDENQVGTFVIDKHFMKDIKGNLRKFSMQTFRCTNCGEKFRRPPLIGKCTNCNMPSINFTIHEGSIKKYVGPSFKIIKEYNVDPYVIEVLELANLRIEGVFGKEIEKQKSLSDFWSK